MNNPAPVRDLFDLNAETMTKFKPKTYHQVRLENAADAYKSHKSIFIDPVAGELPGFQPWPEFRDAFLIDWKSNRRLVTDKEADVIFDKIADESLSELESIGAPTDVNALAEQAVVDAQDDEVADLQQALVAPVATVAVAPTKRRGRPPTAKVVAAVREVRAAVRAVKAVVKPVRKVAAAKKGGNLSTKAQALIEKYSAKGWSRKDILVKMQGQFDITAANAGYYWQKFAK